MSLGFPFIAFVQYAHGAFGPTFYLRNHGVDIGEVGIMLGSSLLLGASWNSYRRIAGDKLRKTYPMVGFTSFSCHIMIAPSTLLIFT
ncbi:MAG: hypothetical protein Ct9H300mP3_04380 [Gammaproteobacteria bacterium]|nr:MAG: hypothetical protein Ct9H300mP3_04380 [Gammaproteobacteria bacterium]